MNFGEKNIHNFLTFYLQMCLIFDLISFADGHAGLAQLVEQLNRNQSVTGSIPVAGTITLYRALSSAGRASV